jgi:ABC-type uncharacterized transport system substrate-binding protein
MIRAPTAARPGYKVSVAAMAGVTACPAGASIPARRRAIVAAMNRHLALVAAAILVGLTFVVRPALAHPHVWVTMKSHVIYAADGTVTGVRHSWIFDDMFSAFAVQGIETKKRGEYTREDLMPLAKTNVESLKDFEYFTLAKANGKRVDFADPAGDYYLEYKDAILTLHFTLPLKTPVKAQQFDVEIYDPSYFVDFAFVKENPVALVGAPPACKFAVVNPTQMDPAMAQRLLDLGPDTKLDPSEFLGSQFANKILVKCP